MTNTDKYLDNYYKKVRGIVEDELVLVQGEDGLFYAKKRVSKDEIGLANKLKKIHHVNVARIYDAYKDEEYGYIIEEFVNGVTLEEKMEASSISEKQAFYYALQICRGLFAVHSRKFVHRDISSKNIMVLDDDTVKIVDFGIAREYDQNKTTDTVMMGTNGYAAPEQYGFSQSDARSDIYSVGVLLNEMLTGQLPQNSLWRGRGQEIISKATAMDPRDRYEYAYDMANDIEEILINSKDWELDITRGLFREQVMIFNRSTKIRALRFRVPKGTWLPGFRSGYLWKMIVALAYYFVCLLLIIPDMKVGEATREIYWGNFRSVMAIVWYAWLICNIFRWDRFIGLKGVAPLPRAIVRTVIATGLMCLYLFFVNF